MKRLCAVLLILSALSFSSCSEFVSNGDYYIGETITPSMLESLEDKFSDNTDKADKETVLDASTELYWTSGGSKLHLTRECRYLANTDKENIKSGNYSKASTEGLCEFCSACLKEFKITDEEISALSTNHDAMSSETPESTEKESAVLDKDTELYWTLGGTKYHIFKDCQSLSSSDESKIKSGKADDAKHDGKESACSFCLKELGLCEEDLPWNENTNDSD